MTEPKTNPILERAKAHLADQERTEIEVPEWGEDGEDGPPLMLYASPLTMHERRMADRKAKGDDLVRLVEILIIKAEKADGDKAFTREDKTNLLREVDSSVVARIVKKIVGVDDDDDDEPAATPRERAAKN